MSKKRRKKKKTSFACVEGHREQCFLNNLLEVYSPRDIGINFTAELSAGGSADKIVNVAIHEKNNRNRSFAWLDEDFESVTPLSDESLRKLADCWCVPEDELDAFMGCSFKDLQTCYNAQLRNPVLVVSSPVSVESVILKALGEALPVDEFDPQFRAQQIQTLKDRLNQLIGQEDELEFYRARLQKAELEAARQDNPQLDLIVSSITNI